MSDQTAREDDALANELRVRMAEERVVEAAIDWYRETPGSVSKFRCFTDALDSLLLEREVKR